MTVGVGLLIEATDYNAIRAKVSAVMGIGAGTSGYGQSMFANSDVSIGQLVTAQQLTNLQLDIFRAKYHQAGNLTGLQATNPVAYATKLIEANDFSTLNTDADYIGNVSRRFDLHSSQTANETITTGTRSTAWNGTITHTATLTFNGYTTITPPNVPLVVTAANHARAFFNAGGKIRISASRTGGTLSQKNTAWTTMFSQIGEIWFAHSGTTVTGNTGTPATSIGWYNLTTNNQVIYQKNSDDGYYSSNSYVIYARRDAGSTQAIFTIQFQDNDTGNPGVDENVDGDLNSYVGVYRPQGTIAFGPPVGTVTSVSVTAPTSPASSSIL